MRRAASFLVLASGLLGVAACAGEGAPPNTAHRESGQSSLMNDTFAGKNRCNPDEQDRPFVVEWDATDMSSLESIAAQDVVVVRYEGCKLTVLDRCRNESIHGALGAYKPVDWTSGQLETVDLANEGELFAKLPLGAASLGGRVNAGEKFHMEYFVAGTRSASRGDVYRADLEKLPGCEGATHFVYGYNLGAFALGSVKQGQAEAGGSLYGFGAGGNAKSHHQVDKKGGNLGVCSSDSATEVAGCKAPIRLILRTIALGENPDKSAHAAPETDASLNAAGQIAVQLDMSDKAREHVTAAEEKFNSGDGQGCLTELDAHDQLDPKHKSTDPKGGLGLVRGQCLMLAGKCDAGKDLVRKSWEASSPSDTQPGQSDTLADGLAAKYCQGTHLSERDQFLKALRQISQSSFVKTDLATCRSAYDTVVRLRDTVKPRGEDDSQVVNAQRLITADAPRCFGKAGDCESAYKTFVAEFPKEGTEKWEAELKKKILASQFESSVPSCKGKVKL